VQSRRDGRGTSLSPWVHSVQNRLSTIYVQCGKNIPESPTDSDRLANDRRNPTRCISRTTKCLDKGDFSRTLTMPDVFTGRAQLGVLGNNARVHMTAGLNLAAAAIPYEMGGFDADSGSEFMNHEVMHWSADQLILFTRSLPY